jgi:antitoxin component YwqK of YwqJK toxin-antitoxin module
LFNFRRWLFRWYENGQKESERNYKDGKQEGLVTLWYENGKKLGKDNYKNGILQH